MRLRRTVTIAACVSIAFATLTFGPAAAQSDVTGIQRVVVNNGWESVDVGLPLLVEDVAEVTLPVTADGTVPMKRHPVVVLLHGQHDFCYDTGSSDAPAPTWCYDYGDTPVPSYQGYRYVADALARDGRIVLSVSADGINAQANANSATEMTARGSLIEHHLQSLANANIGLTYDGALKDRVDLNNVVLMGHSRGGEGVMHAAQQINRVSGSPYTIGGIMNFAPVNNSLQAVGSIPVVNLLPACDGDVYDLAGQSYVDRSRDLYGSRSALQSSVWIPGGNHNYLNTEWTPGLSVSDTGADDSQNVYTDTTDNGSCSEDVRLTPSRERTVGRTYLVNFARMIQDGDQSALAYFDGSGEVPASVDRVRVPTRSSSIGGPDRLLLVPTPDTPLQTRRTTAEICRGSMIAAGDDDVCAAADIPMPEFATAWLGPYWVANLPNRYAVDTSWTQPGTTWIALPDAVDVSDSPRISARVVLDPTSKGEVGLALRDGSGKVAKLTTTGPPVVPLTSGDRALRLWPQTLWSDLRTIAGDEGVEGLDLTDITDIGLTTSGAGRAWLVDASARRQAPAAASRLLPTASISDVFVAAGPGAQTIEVPVKLDAPSQLGAEFAYTVTATGASRILRDSVGIASIAPGSRNTTIPVDVVMPQASGPGQTRTARVHIYALTGASVGDAVSQVTVVASGGEVRIAKVVQPTVSTTPGGRLTWTVTVSGDETDDDITFYGSVVPTDYADIQVQENTPEDELLTSQIDRLTRGLPVILPAARVSPGVYQISLPIASTSPSGGGIEIALVMDGAYLPNGIDLVGLIE